MSESTNITFETHDDHIHAVLSDKAAQTDALERFREQLGTESGAPPGLPLLLDLGQIELLPSEALGALLVLKRTLADRQQRLVLVEVQPEVRKMLAITHLDKLFELRDSRAEALEHLNATN